MLHLLNSSNDASVSDHNITPATAASTRNDAQCLGEANLKMTRGSDHSTINALAEMNLFNSFQLKESYKNLSILGFLMLF